MRLGSWAALALLCAAIQAPAQAKPTDAIQLALEDCEDVPGTSVRELVVLEVAPRTVLSSESAEPAATRARLSCHAGIAAISVEEVSRATPLRLEITLSELARPARPRLLALAVAELIATSRLQRPQPKAAEPEAVREQPEPTVESYEPPATSEASASAAQLWLAVGAARVAEPGMLAGLGALGASFFWRALAISTDLRFEHSQIPRGLSDLGLTSGSLALVPAWRLHAPGADLLLGAGVRAGVVSLSASTSEQSISGSAVTGFWLAPCAQLALHARLARRWSLRIGVEAAYVTRTVRGLDQNGVALLELGDLSLAAQLGVSWDLSDPG